MGRVYSEVEAAPLLGEHAKDNLEPDSLTWKTQRRRRILDRLPTARAALLGAFALVMLCGVLGTVLVLRRSNDSVEVIKVPSGTHNPAFLIKARHGAVATENEHCSTIGVDVLRDGGNAVDAAIAATLCIGVVSMFSAGIGGGGWLTVREAPGRAFTIDFRETAPAKSNATMFGRDPLSSLFGGLSVGVPGELRGLDEAHRRWGSLPWARLVTPAAELGKGWRVGPELARRLEHPFFKTFMETDPDFAPIFAPTGSVLKEGDWIARTNLSRTLATIAHRGAEAFYSGPIAESLIAKINATGGIMTLDDFAAYRVDVRAALQGMYRGRRFHTTHAPSSGAVLLHFLNAVERFDLPKDGRTPLNLHRTVEALKFGAAARTRIGDPAFLSDMSRIAEIPTKAFGAAVSANITDDETHDYPYYNPVFDVPEDHGTMHTAVVDKNHMAVSLTSTVNLVFGSRVMDPITGVLLNDELDDFSRPGMPNYFGLFPSPYNYAAGGKRPLSSICPTIIEEADGSLYAVLGASGGSRIWPAVGQVLLNFDYGLDASAAIEAPRAHHQLIPEVADMDSGFADELLDGLRARGHNVSVHDINEITSVVQAIVLRDGVLWAASDSRKNGIAAGY